MCNRKKYNKTVQNSFQFQRYGLGLEDQEVFYQERSLTLIKPTLTTKFETSIQYIIYNVHI